MYVLIVVYLSLVTGGNTHHHSVAMHDFTSQANCEAAAEVIKKWNTIKVAECKAK